MERDRLAGNLDESSSESAGNRIQPQEDVNEFFLKVTTKQLVTKSN
jgi:hypothetical protein